MYEALWRVLPGPWWSKLLIVLVLVAAVLAVLVLYVFPWVQETYFAPIDITVE